MKSSDSELINISDLRIGLYVELELGWMSHPFPTGSFKITSPRQIETIRGLGLKQVRYVPAKSDSPSDGLPSLPAMDEASAARALAKDREFRRRRAALIESQQQSLKACEQKFGVAQQQYRRVQEQVLDQPQLVRDECVAMIEAFVQEMACDGEAAIRLLSEGVGERAAMHPVNVTVMSLLLGKAMGLAGQALVDLGVGAFLHDVGKLQLPQRVRWFEDGFSIEDFKLYQEHVNKGVAIANRMQLSEGALMAIAQHHELIDGTGFPMRPPGGDLTMPARILALVNRYDNLCNPVRLVTALTPHEALSLLFAQHKARFDNIVLSAFIRMMGVYPPGSVVQLIDGRYALVVSVNSVRPLKPRVIVHEPSVPKHEALILDLESQPGIGIRRSLKPASLPPEALEYLGPRQRIAYYFESSGPAPLADA
ncbi:HD-GYP domain-containing protein [Curvibacter sp. PAE-UM]|uniref:HD-GYP domain-containing protein n=1 Tax=Curvibacter sp. PAE-UM TaxID=1714344 RepID=UPI000711097D|nr:HD-GYP domain-containing protein [Curvibacter sp. PAE-UM]KRI00691.1 phosphohydrolase [Curvibacter sp. PAE-UM]